jgi:signal transduction histidine kinase
MSLRTKLLAAIVGLNGAILLLALYLMLRGGPERSEEPLRDASLDLVWLGGALTADADDLTRARALERVRELEARGPLKGVHVVEERGPDPDSGYRVWSALDLFGSRARPEEVPEGAARERILDVFQQARKHRNRWVDGDDLAVVLPYPMAHLGSRGLVARYAAPPDARSGVRAVYVVMVLGVIALTAVSFWLVSRLVIRPLARISEAADRIASGDFRVRVATRGTNDEFDRTTAAFNRMAGEIAEYQGHLEDRVLSALNRMRKAKQHLAIAQRLAATGKLASGVAHEINNPLGGMQNAVRALARGDLSPEKAEQYLELVADGLSRVEETVKKFLSFTPRHVEPRPTDLGEVVKKTVLLAEHRVSRAGIALEVAAGPGPAVVFGDPHELQQVALNLLLNAVDAVAEAPAPRIEVSVLPGREEVVLEVRDNGVGMSPEEQDRCFDLFVTTKDVGEGTGLGLAVVHNIVTNHGGRIEVESERGQGATFRVHLPAEAGEDEVAE